MMFGLAASSLRAVIALHGDAAAEARQCRRRRSTVFVVVNNSYRSSGVRALIIILTATSFASFRGASSFRDMPPLVYGTVYSSVLCLDPSFLRVLELV